MRQTEGCGQTYQRCQNRLQLTCFSRAVLHTLAASLFPDCRDTTTCFAYSQQRLPNSPSFGIGPRGYINSLRKNNVGWILQVVLLGWRGDRKAGSMPCFLELRIGILVAANINPQRQRQYSQTLTLHRLTRFCQDARHRDLAPSNGFNASDRFS